MEISSPISGCQINPASSNSPAIVKKGDLSTDDSQKT
jgi:hypothetical protein